MSVHGKTLRGYGKTAPRCQAKIFRENPPTPETVKVFNVVLSREKRGGGFDKRFVHYVGHLGTIEIGIMQTGVGKWRAVFVVSSMNTIQSPLMTTAEAAAAHLEETLASLAKQITEAKDAVS